jgi:CRISPR-associated protein Cas5h
MDVLRFTIEGRFGFFKKPDVNVCLYFSYGNIHKVALLGIFGAILGYKGYNQMSFNKKYKKVFKGLIEDDLKEYPEFYEKLQHLRVGIKPKETVFNKKVQVFNNSVGYASKELGGNLIVREQWLENPSWDIYVAIDNEESRKLVTALEDRNFTFIPYLGKNDHLADIKNIEVFSDISEAKEVSNIDSLFIKDDFNIVIKQDSDDLTNLLQDDISTFKYEEKLPIALEEKTNKYELSSFIYTNANLREKGTTPVYNVCDNNIVFI